jgi:hypothetical protein
MNWIEKKIKNIKIMLWNKIYLIFEILINLFMKVKDAQIVKNGYDTGVRATFQGKMYVDKKVFFSRPDVRDVLKNVMESKILKAHIKSNKKSKK